MSLGSQMLAFQRRTATFRQAVFGTNEDGTPETIDYNNGEATGVSAYYTSFKEHPQTEQSGFLDQHDGMVRIVKPVAFTPVIDALIAIGAGESQILLRIEEILGTHPLSAEWILGCAAQN